MDEDFEIPEATEAERDEILVVAREQGRQQLPCTSCGSRAEPLIRKPQRLSLAWWDDPSCYIGCASCGAYLAELPDAYPWGWETEVAQDLEEDPKGSEVNPRELD